MKRKRGARRSGIAPYIMILPAYSVYLLFVLVPVFAGLAFSFTNYDFYKKMDFVGLKNYIDLMHDMAVDLRPNCRLLESGHERIGLAGAAVAVQ